jgi:hypothetical protein
MTLFALQCPRIQGLIVLVLLLLLLLLFFHTTRSGDAPSAPAINSGILKMLHGIFATCQRTDQCLDVMDPRLQIVRRNQEIIHNQWDEPLQEFPDVPVFPPVPDPYGWFTDSCRVDCFWHWHRPTTTRRWRMTSSRLHFIALFPFGVLTTKGRRVLSLLVFFILCGL